MKKIYSIIVLSFISIGFVFAQNGFDGYLNEIEQNNTTLAALKMHAEASKLNSKTGIYLQNPEIGFNYLWGSPDEIGTRTDFNVMQTFDFPSSYHFRGNIADLKMEQADLEYLTQRADILYEARLVCIDLVYYNALLRENEIRMEYAKNIAEAMDALFKEGKISILEHNKARLNYANATSDHALLESEANSLLSDLKRLNGGNNLSFVLSVFPMITLPENFGDWFSIMERSNPVLLYLDKQTEISENEEKLSRAMSLPKFAAGYMSENVVGEKYQGLSVGMSIPLWENKNTVKAARAQTAANLSLIHDSRLQLYTILETRYERILALKNAADGYTGALLGASNTELLKRAYDLGEISLIEYMVEVQFYYDTMVKAFETQREMHKALAELEKWN